MTDSTSHWKGLQGTSGGRGRLPSGNQGSIGVQEVGNEEAPSEGGDKKQESMALSCCLPCGVDFPCHELRFPLLLGVGHVNILSPRVAPLLRTLFDLTRHQDPAVFQLGLSQSVTFIPLTWTISPKCQH